MGGSAERGMPHSRADEEAGDEDANDGREGQDALHEVWEVGVDEHACADRDKHDLRRGEGRRGSYRGSRRGEIFFSSLVSSGPVKRSA